MCLIKTSNKSTEFVLPVILITDNGFVKLNRYYDNEFILIKAYRQLKSINCKLIPLEPIAFGERVVL